MGTIMWTLLDRRFEDLLGSIILAVMAVIAFLNVIVRYCTSFSFAWTEEITINFFVWVTLLGTARAFREGGHLGNEEIDVIIPVLDRLRAEGMQGGAFDYCLKPIDVLELLEKVELAAQKALLNKVGGKG